MGYIIIKKIVEPAIILREELLKTPCRRFFQHGSCQFEGNCKYTHYSPEQLCELRQKGMFLIKSKYSLIILFFSSGTNGNY